MERSQAETARHTGESLDNPWRTVAEASGRMRVGPKVVYREVAAGRLRAARVGGRTGPIRIHTSWIDSYLEQMAQPIEVGRR